MIDWLTSVNLSIAISGSTVAILGFILNWILRRGTTRLRNFFTVFFSLLFAYTSCVLLNTVSFGMGPDYALFSEVTMYMYSFLSSVLLPLMFFYILSIIGEDWQKSRMLKVIIALWIVYVALLNSTWFTDYIYVITPDNDYRRGSLYFVLLVPIILIIILILSKIYMNKDKLSTRQYWSLVLYMIMPLICTALQMYFYGILFITFGTSIAALLIYVNALIDQSERSLKQAEINAAQRINIMKLQMRPHFVFNTLMSIYYLIDQDPSKAQNVLLDFSNYLRQNYSALTNEDTISFEAELEHTKAYLAVEQIRFEGKITMEYDTPHTDFRLPPLTLQPIVENAVKHGTDPNSEPLTIWITTRKTENASELSVANNGIEFGSSESEGTHIALDNIRERLALICNGTISITGREGGGTVVTIVLPD